jgi:hypothetical protein
VRIPFLDWFRAREEASQSAPPALNVQPVTKPDLPLSEPIPVAKFMVCGICKKLVTTWRAYGDGRKLCVSCATEAGL